MQNKNTEYTVRRNAAGERFIAIGNELIPADIAALCSGKDAWISQIQCKCRTCKQPFPLKELQGNGQWCEPCQDAAVEADIALNEGK